jgi:hypothetical protein
VSWYFYHGGSTPRQWDIDESAWLEVSGIFLKPCHWQQPDKFKRHGNAVFFAVSRAKDIRHKAGGGLFPECLRSEYHGIRSAMEAYAKSSSIAGVQEGDANGISLDGNDLLTIRINEESQTYLVSL